MNPLRALTLLAGIVLASLAQPVTAAPPLTNVQLVVAGAFHACVLMSNGSVKCWGMNSRGQLGDGSTLNRSVPGEVSGLNNGVIAIAAGNSHTCALKGDQSIVCWGANESGQLGDGTRVDRLVPVTARPASGTPLIAQLRAGAMHTCFSYSFGGVLCWGANGSGQLGDGTTTDKLTPTIVPTMGNAAVLALGDRHTCVMTFSTGAACWGENERGQVGDGTTIDRPSPVTVPGLSGVFSVGSGDQHTCAVTNSGGAKCWGYNIFGQLANGTTTDSPVPTDVTGLGGSVSLIDGGFGHTCVLTTGGGMKCWGLNQAGQLGNGTTSGAPYAPGVPTDVTGLTSGVTSFAAGGQFTCAVTSSTQVMCWGENSQGMMGNNTVGGPQTTPTPVLNFQLQSILFPGLPRRDLNEPPFTVSTSASSSLPVTLTSSTPAVCTVSGFTVTLHAIGICTIAADQPGDATYYKANTVVRSFAVGGTAPGAAPRLVNISSRMHVGTGGNVGIAGFVLQGNQPKQVLVRARGPSLSAAGVSGVLANPVLTLHTPNGSAIAVNDDWEQAAEANTVLMIGMAPVDARESIILTTLTPNVGYTAMVQGAGGTTGVAIVEVFEIDNAMSPLVNISTRAAVGTAEHVLIGGFVIHGDMPQTVVVRARGPSMASQGVGGTMDNPLLQLFSGSTQIAVNDDWGAAANATQIQATGFQPSNPLESAILVTLAPGAYTAIVSGVGGTTGVAIAEVFAVY